MLNAWENLVIKWLNCFDIEPLNNIKDVKERNLLSALCSEVSVSGDEPFKDLLQYLLNHYPNYGAQLSDSNDTSWNEDKELLLLSSLILLHASIYNPSQSFQIKAAQQLSSFDQEYIVKFLQKAMSYEQDLTRESLLKSIPVQEDELRNSQPSTPTPLHTAKQRRSKGTPLADFLSSPVAQQKRRTGNFRDRLCQLECDLDEEQTEKMSLLEKIQEKDAQIIELGRKLKERTSEVKALKEELLLAEAGQENLTVQKDSHQEEKKKLRQEVAESERYIKTLLEEIGDLKLANDSMHKKLYTSEEISSNLKSVLNATHEELRILQSKMLEQSEENTELSLRCNQLERDLNQVHSSRLLSPGISSIRSPNQGNATMSPTPENMGFILEKQMIDVENENIQLMKTIEELQNELRNLKSEHSDLEDKLEKDRESSSRAQRKLESKLEALQQNLDSTAKELSSRKEELNELCVQYANSCSEGDALRRHLEEANAKKASLMSEQKILNDLKRSLDVKVVQLEAKLQLSAEREEELQELTKKRLSELDSMKQEKESLEIKLKASIKEQELIEQQLNIALRKLSNAKSSELEIDDLKEQVLVSNQVIESLEKQLQIANSSCKQFEERINILSEEKRMVESQLKDFSVKKNELLTLCDQLSSEKRALEAEYIALQKDKVRREAELSEALQHWNEAKEQVLKEETEKKTIQNKFAEAIATNERLDSKLSILSQQENDLNTTLQEVIKQKKAVECKLSSISKEKMDLESNLQEMSVELSKADQERESLNHALTTKSIELTEMASDLSHISNLKVELEAQCVAKNEENHKLQSQLIEVVQKLELAKSDYSKLKSELDLSHQQCEEKDSAIQDLAAEKADIEDDLCHYVGQLNTANQENLMLKSEISLLKEEQEKLSLTCEDLTKLRASLEDRIAIVEADTLSILKNKDDLKSQLLSLTEERDKSICELTDLKKCVESLETELCGMRDSNTELQLTVSTQSGRIEHLLAERDSFSAKCEGLLEECDAKSQELSILKGDILELQISFETLQQEKKKLEDDNREIVNKNSSLEEELEKCLSEINGCRQEVTNISDLLVVVKAEKESIEKEKELILFQIKTESDLREHTVNELKEKEGLLAQLQAELECNKKTLSDCLEKVTSLTEEKDKICKELEAVCAEKEEISVCCEQLRVLISDKESQLQSIQEEMHKKTELHGVEMKKYLEDMSSLSAVNLEKDLAIQDLNLKLRESCKDDQLEMKLADTIAVKDDALQHLSEAQQEVKEHIESLKRAEEKIGGLESQIQDLQVTVNNQNEIICQKQEFLDKLQEEMQHFKQVLAEKDQVISKNDAIILSLKSKASDGEVTESPIIQQLKEELQSAKSASNGLSQELSALQKRYEAERTRLQKAQKEANSHHKIEDTKSQHISPSGGGKLADLQQEEALWQWNRVKNQMGSRLDTLIKQKSDLEDHLSQLKIVLDDVALTCDNLFATLPTKCNAVHEVTIMKKEVETKLRAVDKKYAESLCGIITVAYDMFKWMVKQIAVTSGEIETPDLEHLFSPEREIIETKVSALGDVMMSLTCDVTSVINSCKFLSERCESYLKAQTRESLKIKTSFGKEIVKDMPSENCQSLEQPSIPALTDSVKSPEQEGLKVETVVKDNELCGANKGSWFGGAASLEEAYSLMEGSYLELEKKVAILNSQLKEQQLVVKQQPQDDLEAKLTQLQERINALMVRPTREQLDEKLKELHVQYSQKLEAMKSKMKQIVKDEIDSAEEAKIKLEKEIVAKYTKRISEFEEHVRELSAQLWELGNKLLQEQQDHKATKERLATMKERQRQFLMSKQHTQSLDRLDLLLQGSDKVRSTALAKRRAFSQATQTGTQKGTALSRVRSQSEFSTDVVDESVSKRSTMMAPASMVGLAFPEEDEDGEVFNNDYLAELKEGRCRAPLDGSRLSELQYRNSLCPPHLKSSYPLETQFQDPNVFKDEELKGPDGRPRRQAKDRGTTSYKKPGPPTPSKKAGRLSLQGKEDVTPQAALREHNESQASQGSGMLRAAKTTPSRLRALFTSSKVANAATLPSMRKDENSTPATPTSKRLSIFKRRFGSNKENQNASSGYSSFR